MSVFTKATLFSNMFEFNRDKKDTIRVDMLHNHMALIDEEVEETRLAIRQADRAEIVDGFGDVAFLALNGIYKEFRTWGDSHEVATKKVEEVMNRICDANLNKRQADGTVKFVNDKVQKPINWTPPQYEDLLKETA